MKKLLKVFILTFAAYLLQATVSWHISIGGVAPNLAFALIAVVTIAFGLKYTFVMSMIVGYLLEIMLPALDYISCIAYPVCSMIPALIFGDKSERRLEELRTQGKQALQLNPHLRTLLCVSVSTLLFEGINVMYTFLSGVSLDINHILRALFDVFYTTALAAVLLYPLRKWLGVYNLPKAR